MSITSSKGKTCIIRKGPKLGSEAFSICASQSCDTEVEITNVVSNDLNLNLGPL
jgi:hypothetical protein